MAKKAERTLQNTVVQREAQDSFIVGRSVFSIVYLVLILLFQKMGVWDRHFAEAGSLYFLYHLFRVAFFFFFAWIVYSAGKLLLAFITKGRGDFPLNGLDTFLVSSFAGASLLTLVMFFLGLLKAYYTATALLLTVPIAFLSYPELRETVRALPGFFNRLSRDYFKEKGALQGALTAFLLFALVVQFLYLFLSKGLMPDLLTNDTIGHYLPYYQEVLNSHGIGMNKYFPHYYYSKGVGLFFLAGLLTDIQSIQLVSFLFLLLSAAALYALVRKIAGDEPLWVLLSLLLFFSSSIILNESGVIVAEFQKVHVLIGSFIIFTACLTVLALSLPDSLVRPWAVLLLLVTGAALVMSPVSFAFLLPYLLLQSLLFLLVGRAALLRMSFLVTAGLLGIFVALLVFNLFTSGMAEATPLPLFFKYRIESIMRDWISPNAFLMQIQMNTISGEGAGAVGLGRFFQFGTIVRNIIDVLHDGSMIPFIVYFALLVLTAVLVSIASRKGLMPSGSVGTIAPIVCMLLVVYILLGITEQSSIYRYTVFLIFFKIALYIYVLLFSIRALFGATDFKRHVLLFAAVVTAAFALLNFYTVTAKAQAMPLSDKIGFVTGRLSYADLYEKRWEGVILGLKVQKGIGEDKKVVMMNFIPSIYGIPKSRFQRPLMNDFNAYGDFENVLYGSPEKAKEAYMKQSLNHFLIIFDQPLLFPAYSPLFEPRAMKKYFKTAAKGTNVVILTWRSPRDPELSDDIVMQFYNAREANRQNIYALSYEALKKTVRVQPEGE
ncbi:MAG: hypothetical protein IT388_03005 [Nitrospirales bacterium]|nr:hypothetical protein [Nitrospirales bacterium]